MATQKLTAQQKRDRQFMKLLADYEATWQREAATKEAQIAGMEYQNGWDAAAYRYTRLSLWQRIMRRGL